MTNLHSKQQCSCDIGLPMCQIEHKGVVEKEKEEVVRIFSKVECTCSCQRHKDN